VRATSLLLAGVSFLGGAAWYDLNHDTKVVTKERVKTVTVEVTPSPQPTPTYTRLVTPEACARMLPTIGEVIKYLNTTSEAESKLPAVISSAGIHIADHNVPALAGDDEELRSLKDQIDTAHIQARQVIDDLTDTLAECRQELDK
jgi:hypothetical protein